MDVGSGFGDGVDVDDFDGIWCGDVDHASDSVDAAVDAFGRGFTVATGQDEVDGGDELFRVDVDGGGLEVGGAGSGAFVVIGRSGLFIGAVAGGRGGTVDNAESEARPFVDAGDSGGVVPVVETVVGFVGGAVGVVNANGEVSVVPFARTASGAEDIEFFVSADCIEGDSGRFMTFVEADGVVTGVIGSAGPAELVRYTINRERARSRETAGRLVGGGVESSPFIETARRDDSLERFAATPNGVAV